MTPNKINYSSYEVRFEDCGGMDACFKTFRETMKSIADKNGCLFVDLFTPWEKLGDVTPYLIDTCHPTGEGYMIFADVISDCLIYNAEYLTGKEVLTLKDEAKSVYSVKDGKFLTGVKEGITAEEIKAAFDINVEVDEEIFTGSRVTYVTDKGYISAGLKIVIKGDADCSGKVDATDYLTVKRALLNLITAEGAQKEACDTNSDGVIDATDYLFIKRHLLHISSLF